MFSTPLSLKSLDSAGRFAGYASVFGVTDSQNDIVMRGAFEKSIASKMDVKLLWQHQFAEPVGTITNLFEDSHGLYVEGQLLLNVARGREAYTLLKSGAVSGLSIGYSPVDYTIDPVTDVRRISEVKLWEISLVTFPANAEAQVTVVKSSSWPEFRSGETIGPSTAKGGFPYNSASLNSGNDESWKQALRTGEVITLSDAISRARQHLS